MGPVEKAWDKETIINMANILNRLQYEARCCDSYYAERPDLRQAISDARTVLEPYKSYLINFKTPY